MQIIRNELVVALEIVIHHIEEDGSLFTLGALLHDVDGAFVSLK